MDFNHANTSNKFCPAAVLLPFFEKKGELHLILTKRSETVLHHKGQICFPGGAKEDQDSSLWQTALRETEEEIGIKPREVFYINKLKKLITPTYFEITPYIGFIPASFQITANHDEIDSVIEIPMKIFLDKKNLRFEDREYFGKTFKVPFFTCHNHEIWGATGRILLDLIEQWN